MCDHPLAMLVGEAGGIRCRLCGTVFASLDEISAVKKADPEPQPVTAQDPKPQPKPKRGTRKKGVK